MLKIIDDNFIDLQIQGEPENVSFFHFFYALCCIQFCNENSFIYFERFKIFLNDLLH
jgi:hypothetical protein